MHRYSKSGDAISDAKRRRSIHVGLALVACFVGPAISADAMAAEWPAWAQLAEAGDDTEGAPDAEPEPEPDVIGPSENPSGVTLDELVALALQQNPRLSQLGFAVQAARGRAHQAGLYPNPTVSLTWDELGDKTGPSGINSLPLVTQELVTGRKLSISRDAGLREVDRNSANLMAERYLLLADVRSAYFDALALQTRMGILLQVLQLADKSVDQTNKLLDAKEAARLDLVQLEVEAERLRTDLEASERELPSAYKRLAAIVGVRDLEISQVDGTLYAPLPEYELDRTQQYVLGTHPELQAARFGVERARLLVRRAEVEPIPNVAVSAGYVRQNQNRSDDYTLGASVSIPLWNRNQGNIRAAEAELYQAMHEIRRVENSLTDRVATAMRDFVSAKRRTERYHTAILPRADESYQLSLKAYRGGQFEYLRVLEAQRTLAQATLEYIRAMGDAWKAAAVISGLTLEDQWPPSTVEVPPAPDAVPIP